MDVQLSVTLVYILEIRCCYYYYCYTTSKYDVAVLLGFASPFLTRYLFCY
jgi:hypothetical protein